MIIPGQFGFNCPSGFGEEAFWNIFPIGSNKMTTTAGHSFYIGPIGLFYNQVNDTGSWEPLVNIYYGIFYELWTFVDFDRLCKLYRSPGYKTNQLVLCKNYVLQW
jgi:hypothetical protein